MSVCECGHTQGRHYLVGRYICSACNCLDYVRAATQPEEVTR